MVSLAHPSAEFAHASTAPYWSRDPAKILADLQATTGGLSSEEARRRLATVGLNAPIGRSFKGPLHLVLRQFRSPLVLILVFAAIVSAGVGEIHDAFIIGAIVLASCGLGFRQEYAASKAMEALKLRLSQKAVALRDGKETGILAEEVVPGDVIVLTAGSLIPADGIILDARDFNVSESMLTGEAFPVLKSPGETPAGATINQRTNMVFAGTSVRSGSAKVLAVETGERTQFARIAEAVERTPPETDFARGIRRFGYLMTEVMLAIVIVIFAANLALHRPLIESLLFSLALAVGLSPELLPAIISVTLARGAATMARNGVIVRRLEAIENLGCMDVLCTDKTGTLTEGVIKLDGWLDVGGSHSLEVLRWGRLNATLQTGLRNPLDEAIAAVSPEDMVVADWPKVDEIPYDFVRKRLSVTVRETDGQDLLICKGALQNVLEVCSAMIVDSKAVPLDRAHRRDLDSKFREWSAQGYRVLGLAIRRFEPKARYRREDEAELCFAGFLLFLDPAKEDIADVLKALSSRGVACKMISGDNRFVAAHLAEAIGLKSHAILTGEELARMTRDALFGRVVKTDLFVEIDPNQKERIVEALRRHGLVVGYLGDGINDAPALHEADVGISVDGAVDVAREAADMILLQRDLGVLVQGIDDGRTTFANTMKYIAITTSANFGNMISMAVASLFLPFLPMLAKQILLNNLLSDLPSMAIATDAVDVEDTRRPTRWDIGFVRRFMVRFGLISSLFDLATFAFLLFFADATAAIFQTGWFVESLLTELAIVLVVRTRKAFWRSRPSPLLAWLTLAVAVLAIALPYLPLSDSLGFVPLPLPVLCGLVAITAAYVLASEWAKHHLATPIKIGSRKATHRHWGLRRQSPSRRHAARS